MNARSSLAALVLLLPLAMAAQQTPPWSKGANDPALDQGLVFHVPDVDNVPDIHGNPQDPKLVLFIGGNQFFVMPRLIAAFVKLHPELGGHIFYETLPPGILVQQVKHNGVITLGNLTLSEPPDVYEAGARVLDDMQQKHQLDHVIHYTTNDLEIMVAAGNPKHIHSLQDLAAPALRLSMPNAETEGVATQIQQVLRNVGGPALEQAVYHDKVVQGTTFLTQIHHRQTPMRILAGVSDAGVVWASEVRFQQKIGNPIEGVPLPPAQNVNATYAAGILPNAPHPAAAAQWLAFLQTDEAQAAYSEFGFKPVARETH